MKKLFLLLPVFILLFASCQDKEAVIPIEETEVECRLLSIKTDGILKYKYEYDELQRPSLVKVYEQGEFNTQITYVYDNDDKIIRATYADDKGKTLYHFNYIRNSKDNGKTDINELVDVANGKELLAFTRIFSYNLNSNCGASESKRYDKDGTLNERREKEYLDDNCSFIEKKYLTDPRSGQIKLNSISTNIYDDKKHYFESIERHYSNFTSHNLLKREYESLILNRIYSSTYEYSYNEYNYPDRAIITDENGTIEIETYQYSCE